MQRFARWVLGYHGCTKELATKLLSGELAVESWRLSENSHDWLGRGIRLLYVLEQADDLCLDGQTARSITGSWSVPGLVRVVKEAVIAGYARLTGTDELGDADRDFIVGIELTDEGRSFLARVLRLEES